MRKVNEQKLTKKKRQISRLMEFTVCRTTYATSSIFGICEPRTDSNAWWSRLNLLSVPDCIQNHASRTRSLISSSSYLVSARARTLDYRALGKDFSPKFRSRELRYMALPFVRVPARYIVDISPFFSSPSPRRVTQRCFASRHGERTLTLRHCVACRRQLA